MNITGRTVLSAGVVALGCIIGVAPAAASPDGAENVTQTDDQEAALLQVLESERSFLHRRAMIKRLRELAQEENDTSRMSQLDRLMDLDERRYLEQSNARRSSLHPKTRDRLQAIRQERHERMSQAATASKANARNNAAERVERRHDAVDRHIDAAGDQAQDRMDRHRDAVNDRAENRVNRHRDAVNDRARNRVDRHRDAVNDRARNRVGLQRDAIDARMGSQVDGRRDAARNRGQELRQDAAQAHLESEDHRDRSGLSNRADRSAGMEPVKSFADGRRPTPPKRRPPGSRGGGLALPTDGEARTRAIEAINRGNAASVLAQLEREIASDD